MSKRIIILLVIDNITVIQMWIYKWFINSNERISRQYITKSFYLTNTKKRFIQFILNKVSLLSKPACELNPSAFENLYFWEIRIFWETSNIVVKDTKMGFFIFFLEKISSYAGFLGSGLKSIFHSYAHWEITLSQDLNT